MTDLDAIDAVGTELPNGVLIRSLTAHRDARGSFTELFRSEWRLGPVPVQWNVVHSAPGVLRGVHVHPEHDDYLVVVSGRAHVGLCDLRDGAEIPRHRTTVELFGDDPKCIVIPHGVAHGFLFGETSVHIYAVTNYWSTDDELGCRFDDPVLGIDWPYAPTELSPRDASLPTLAELRAQLYERWGANAPSSFAD